MTDRHGFHDHYGKDRPKDAEDKLDVDDPDMSKRPVCSKCKRKTYPWDFASKAWHKAHPKKNYCQASRSVDGTGDSPHMDWHIDCDGKDISIGVGVVKDTEGKKCDRLTPEVEEALRVLLRYADSTECNKLQQRDFPLYLELCAMGGLAEAIIRSHMVGRKSHEC